MNSGMHARKQTSGCVSSIASLVLVVGLAFLLAQAAKTFVFQGYEVPSASMESTIEVGDMFISEKVSYYFREPQAGDVITFQDPDVPGRTLVKRVIAVGGQTVDLSSSDGVVYVDGQALDEPYATGGSYPLISDISYPYTVPEGCLWVMGENRENSQDSRYFGAVKASTVTGHAVFTYWPIAHVGVIG